MGTEISQRIKDAVKKYHQEAITLSDALAANPELPYEEFESSKKMAALLEEHGYEVEYPYLGYETAFCGKLCNGDGPSVAVLVEYDALPDIGHGCGHNLHGSLSILTGLALMELKDQFKGTVYVIGTPAEEEDGAKIGMAAKGVFDHMAAAMMMHSIGGGVCQPDMDALSLRCYVIEFHGQTAHAVSAPWEGRSALAAARKFLDLIDARRECFTPDVRVNAVILDGGKAPNIIPDHAEIRLEFRTNSIAKLKVTDDAVLKCAKAAAMALDCEVTWKPGLSDFADMVRIPALEDEIKDLLEDLGEEVSEVMPPSGSSDMGNVSYCCPAIQPMIAITKEKYALHTKQFAACTTQPMAYEAMAKGAQALTALALKVLCDDDFREKVQRDFVAQRDAKQ